MDALDTSVDDAEVLRRAKVANKGVDDAPPDGLDEVLRTTGMSGIALGDKVIPCGEVRIASGDTGVACGDIATPRAVNDIDRGAACIFRGDIGAARGDTGVTPGDWAIETARRNLTGRS